MSEEQQKQNDDELNVNTNSEGDFDGTETPSESLSEEDVSVLQTRIIELETAHAEMKDKALRALAEAENTRKRAERDRLDASKFAIAKFARDLLDVSDNMQRALAAIPEDQKEGNELVKNIVVGIEATDKALLKVFETHGVTKIAPTEGKFDPNFHEAMFETEIPGKPAGEIIQLIEPGYVLNDRLLRPARVGVSKAAASPSATHVDEEA